MNKISLKKCFETPNNYSFFFGYFNTPQVSADDKKLLALKIERFDRVPEPNDIAEVGFFDLEKKDYKFNKVGETNSFNWQQGAQLQFLGPDFKEKIIWNFFDGKSYKSRIYDLANNSFYDVPAIYNPLPNGKFAITIDYERHYWYRRGYSYGNIINPLKREPISKNDAIWKIDLKNGKKTILITLENMINLKPISSMKNAIHYFEHITASPNSKEFAFLHRWKHENGIHSRLIVSDIYGKKIKIINDSGRMSHFCWSSSNQIIGYGGKSNTVTNFRKNKFLIKTIFKTFLPIYKKIIKDNTKFAKIITGDGYYTFNTYEPINQKIIFKELRNEDGHPTMNPDSDYFITDTYARSALNQKPKLYYINLKNNIATQIAELNSINNFDESPLRCDLHPRISKSGKILTIDTMDNQNRRIYAYFLN